MAIVLAVMALAFLALPGSAFGNDLWVDNTLGDNGPNDCSDMTNPCQSIALATILATPTDIPPPTIHVDDDAIPYAENVSLSQNTRLVEENFIGGDEPQATIDGGTGTAITVNETGGEIRGFRIRGDEHAIQASRSVTIANNLFDEGTPPTAMTTVSYATVEVTGATTSATVTGNTFTDPSPTDDQWGLNATTANALTAHDNTLTGYRFPISSFGVNTTDVRRNTIVGLHQGGGIDGFGIAVTNGTATIFDNLIHQPGPGPNRGIDLGAAVGAPGVNVSATLRRNRVFNLSHGIDVSDTTGPVTLEADVVANNSTVGVQALDFGDGAPQLADVTATNVTVFGNGTDFDLNGADLTLNSSIVGNAIASTASCTITFSRGAATVPGGNGCQNFQTAAAPSFVNPSTNNFHLQFGSAMIDAGNPLAPPAGTTDFEGQARAIDGNCDGVGRRDIGADEFVSDCVAPVATITSGPSGETDDSTPTFEFAANEAGSTFACRLDSEPFGSCSGPGNSHTPAAPLSNGAHAFEVRATDAVGNTGPAASQGFTVNVPSPPEPGPGPGPGDTDPPETVVIKGPKKESELGKGDEKLKVKFKFASSEANSTFQCKLDRKPFEDCTSPAKYKVGEGVHKFVVQAIDPAGNLDPTPAERKFRVK